MSDAIRDQARMAVEYQRHLENAATIEADDEALRNSEMRSLREFIRALRRAVKVVLG